MTFNHLFTLHVFFMTIFIFHVFSLGYFILLKEIRFFEALQMLQGGTFIFSVLLETHSLQWLGIIKKEYQYS